MLITDQDYGAEETKSEQAELLPCPFCGNRPVVKKTFSPSCFWIKCETCQFDRGYRNSLKLAIKEWNSRPQPNQAHKGSGEKYPIGPNPREYPDLRQSMKGANPDLYLLAEHFKELAEHYDEPHNRAPINSEHEHERVLSARRGRAEAYRRAQYLLINLLQWYAVPSEPETETAPLKSRLDEAERVIRYYARDEDWGGFDKRHFQCGGKGPDQAQEYLKSEAEHTCDCTCSDCREARQEEGYWEAKK